MEIVTTRLKFSTPKYGVFKLLGRQAFPYDAKRGGCKTRWDSCYCSIKFKNFDSPHDFASHILSTHPVTTHSSSKRTIISALTRVEFVSILVIISIGEYVHSGPVIHDVEPVAHRVGVQGILHQVFRI